MSSNNQMRQILTGLSASRRSLISRSLWHLSAFQSALGRTLDRLFPTDDPPAFQLALAEEVPPPRWLTQIREAENKDVSPLAGLLGPISWIKGQTAKRRFSYYELKRKWYTLKTNSHMNKFGRPLLQVTHCLEVSARGHGGVGWDCRVWARSVARVHVCCNLHLHVV